MQRSSLIIALLTIALGVVIVLAALGFFPVSDESFSAPGWVVGLAGCAFLTAGLLLLLTLQKRAEAGVESKEPRLKVFMRGGFTVLLLTIFAVLSHWVAFGSGASNFQAGSQMPMLVGASTGGGTVSRLGFVAGALLVDGLLILGVVDLIRRVLYWRSISRSD